MSVTKSLPQKNVFRCAHCSWNTPKWRTRKDGKTISGWPRLQDHLLEEHGITVDLIGEGEDE